MSDTTCRSLNDFIGEYHVCDSDNQYLYAIWTDGRNGDDNDLYFTKALLSELATSEHIVATPKKHYLLKAPTIIQEGACVEIMPCTGSVSVRIFDVNGRLVNTLYKGSVITTMNLPLSISELPHGVLFIHMSGQDIHETVKTIHVK